METARNDTEHRGVADDVLVPINLALELPLLDEMMYGRKPFELIRCESLTDIERFVRCRNDYPGERRCMLSPYTSAEYIERKSSLYLTPDGHGGVAVIGGELASLFSYPGARYGGLLVEAAKLLGAEHLSCFDCDGALPRFYGRHGFREIARYTWDPQYAPAEWNYEVFGTPDVVEMEL